MNVLSKILSFKEKPRKTSEGESFCTRYPSYRSYPKSKRGLRLLSIFLALVFMLSAGCSQNQTDDDYITIGVLLPLTGESADKGIRSLNGLQLAKTKINDAGGILGKKLELLVLDDKGDGEYIIQQYEVLKEKGVSAVIGSNYSSITVLLAEASVADGIPIISPTASNPIVTEGRDNVFRAIFVDEYQTEVMARFARESLNAQTAVVLFSDSNDGWSQLSGFFADEFELRGGTIIGREHYRDEDDFESILAKYTENPPDVIYCPEDSGPAAKIVNAAFEIGLDDTVILGSDAWTGLLLYVRPEAMENCYFTSPFSYDDSDPAVAEFVEDYFTAFSHVPISDAANAYAAAYILAEAMEKAGSVDYGEVVAAMKSLEIDSIVGKIKFDENNNPHTNVYIIQIKDGVYAMRDKLSYEEETQ